jgi:hypothetical protein
MKGRVLGRGVAAALAAACGPVNRIWVPAESNKHLLVIGITEARALERHGATVQKVIEGPRPVT